MLPYLLGATLIRTTVCDLPLDQLIVIYLINGALLKSSNSLFINLRFCQHFDDVILVGANLVSTVSSVMLQLITGNAQFVTDVDIRIYVSK